ncbi:MULTISPECIES: AraC family transcriptional regulator [unclassified Neisseria]|uniref:AraC family transcriptional regulator n=1 Tax=unclassified Neisseria TaxID=2623750 RepID=UPI0026670B90|nr:MULTISPECIES: AraC family transcriptional regulator [unclassified Neisseria]MDO1509273.1 AraC family transcriptional regulator [Neisseria sp. MVDL19-042950]MDO1515448.1 AraC family transcriptional regulator [Neisseria sp. MVDL18-041461]MDO1562808.1 AraC family transcriptional regulator [Neisseria sp. MVDL20-010259]
MTGVSNVANTKVLGHSVLVSWVSSICQTARGYGVDPLPLLEEAGLDLRLLHIPDARYQLDGVRRFWELLIRATGDPLFGLKVGQEIQASALQGLGLAIISCGSLADLMMIMVRYCKIISTTMRISFDHTPELKGTKLVLRTDHGSEPMNAARLAMLAFIYRQACSLSQHHVQPVSVTLSMPECGNTGRLDDYFQVPVNLGCEKDSITFAYEDTIEPYAGANHQLMHMNEAVVGQYLNRLNNMNISSRVSTLIRDELKNSEPRLCDIASKLNLSPRTLQRRLRDEGHSFNSLLDDIRQEIAHDLLMHSNQSITEIGFQLGFSDLSNFIRASHRWFGCTPLQHRENSLLISI